MVHDYIRQSRDDQYEVDHAGLHISKLEGSLPPCSRDISAFSPNPSVIVHHDPLGWRHLPQVKEELPPYSFCTSPYGRMFSGKDDTTWENDPKIQSDNLKEYFDPIGNDSLVFFYVDHGNPLIEDPDERVLVGVARVDSVGDQLYFPQTKKYPDNFPLWSRRITLNPAQMVRLPYQEYLQKGLDASNMVCRVPNSVREQFSYVSEHLTDDDAVVILERLIQSTRVVLEDGKIPGPWSERLQWLGSLLSETWQNRGPYPGIGSVLAHLGARHGAIYQLEVLRIMSSEGKNPKTHILSILNERMPVEKGFEKDLKIAQRAWKSLPSGRKELLSLLFLFELTEQQVDRLSNSTSRKAAGIGTSETEILTNPYLLCELDQGGKDSSPISFDQIDHGLTKAWNEEDSVYLTDKRRVRALVVKVMRDAAEEGDTLLSLEEAIERVQASVPKERPCQPDRELVMADQEFYKEMLDFGPEADYPFFSLKSIRLMEIDAAECLAELVSSKIYPPSGIDWQEELRKELGEAGKTHLDEAIEGRAQAEKATALETLFRHRLSVLTGRAGTGKTTAANILLKHLMKEGDVLLLAPTGKARIRLQEITSLPAKTIHQFLWENEWITKDTMRLKEIGGKKLGATTVVIDEASMIPLDLFSTLTRAIEFNDVRRLVVIGDPNQLPPIGPGRPFSDLIRWLTESPQRKAHLGYLSERARQEEHESVVLKLSDGYTYEPPTPNEDEILSDIALGYNEGDLEVHLWNTPEELLKTLLDRMRELLDLNSDPVYISFNRSLGIENSADVDVEHWQILSPVRMRPHGTWELNRIIQRTFRSGLMYSARTSNDYPQPFGNQEIIYTDKVIQTNNQSRSGWNQGPSKGYVANGEVGIVSATQKGGRKKTDHLQVRFSTQPKLTYGYFRNEVNSNLELAYSITVHKAQGSDFDIVFLIIPQSTRNLSRELLYTGLTRSRKKLVLLIERDISPLRKFRQLARSETIRRNTNLFTLMVRAEGTEIPFPEKLIHRTITGELVRSKSEVVVANILTKLGITYYYEKPIEYAPNDFRLPDFTATYKGQTVYWEHLGMLNLPYYKRDWERRRKWYERHNLIDKVITSQDGPDGGIDSQEIERLARERILGS
jgi:hypothetical protein